jgi:hypothetical protein
VRDQLLKDFAGTLAQLRSVHPRHCIRLSIDHRSQEFSVLARKLS